MLHWSKRLAEWRTVLAQKGVKVSPLALLHAVLSGPVPSDVWRTRIRTCLRCPVYNAELKACYAALSDGRTTGCGCYTPFKALTAAPYSKDGGCWAREITKGDSEPEGWPAYRFSSWREKLGAVWRFVA